MIAATPPLREKGLADHVREAERSGPSTSKGGRAASSRWWVGRTKTLALEAVGLRDVESGASMETTSIFRVMSLTKPITSVAVMMLVDEKKIGLDDPVERHLPEFRGQKLYAGFSGDKPRLVPSPRPITVRDLLTHTSGLLRRPAARDYTADPDKHPEFSLTEAVKALGEPPASSFPPGTKWAYSNAGMTTLGRLVEGHAPDVALVDVFPPGAGSFGLLGMVDTTLPPP